MGAITHPCLTLCKVMDEKLHPLKWMGMLTYRWRNEFQLDSVRMRGPRQRCDFSRLLTNMVTTWSSHCIYILLSRSVASRFVNGACSLDLQRRGIYLRFFNADNMISLWHLQTNWWLYKILGAFLKRRGSLLINSGIKYLMFTRVHFILVW